MVEFTGIPNNLRVPFFATEFDNTRAVQGPAVKEYNVLLLGQKLAAGTKLELEKFVLTSQSQARQFFGAGSMVAEMYAKYRDNNSTTKCTAISIDDDGAGVASTGSQLFAGTCTKAGTLYAYIAGKRITIAVAVGDTAADVVSALVTAIQAEVNRLLDSAINATPEQIDFTARNDGVEGDSLDFRFNYFDGEELPEGITLSTTTDMNGGAGNPDIAEIIAVIGDTQYDFIINPWLDTANLVLLEAELDTRWEPLAQIDGRYISAKLGTYASLSAFGAARNSKHGCVSMAEGPTPPYLWAAALTAEIAASTQIDPARPFQTLVLDVMAPAPAEQLDFSERNLLLFDGISTNKITTAGNVLIERMITLYQTNAFGAEDVSYLDLNTPLTLSFLRYDWNNSVALKYPRHKLANDGAKVAPGAPIVTPKEMRAHAYIKADDWEEAGLIESAAAFKELLVVERPSGNVTYLDVLMVPDLVNQFRVLRNLIQFQL